MINGGDRSVAARPVRNDQSDQRREIGAFLIVPWPIARNRQASKPILRNEHINNSIYQRRLQSVNVMEIQSTMVGQSIENCELYG